MAREREREERKKKWEEERVKEARPVVPTQHNTTPLTRPVFTHTAQRHPLIVLYLPLCVATTRVSPLLFAVQQHIHE